MKKILFSLLVVGGLATTTQAQDRQEKKAMKRAAKAQDKATVQSADSTATPSVYVQPTGDAMTPTINPITDKSDPARQADLISAPADTARSIIR